MKYKAMYKNEIAERMGISRGTMRVYMKRIEHLLPHYRRRQMLLSPDQVKIVVEHYCIDEV